VGNDFNPDWVSPPGDTMRDIMEERGISPASFARLMRMTRAQADQLLYGNMAIDQWLAVKLQLVLGSTAGFWLTREKQYREDKAKQDERRAGALVRIGYRDVEPIGKERTFGHQNRGDQPHVWGDLEVNVYPDSWEGMRLAVLRRRELGLTLGEAARVLDLGVAQLSSLERGAAVCDWKLVEQLLRARLAELVELMRDA
jgi:plasmid maintenance system antidote protein VapI